MCACARACACVLLSFVVFCCLLKTKDNKRQQKTTKDNKSCLLSDSIPIWLIRSRSGEHIDKKNQNNNLVFSLRVCFFWSPFFFPHLIPPALASKHVAVAHARGRRECPKQERTRASSDQSVRSCFKLRFKNEFLGSLMG